MGRARSDDRIPNGANRVGNRLLTASTGGRKAPDDMITSECPSPTAPEPEESDDAVTILAPKAYWAMIRYPEQKPEEMSVFYEIELTSDKQSGVLRMEAKRTPMVLVWEIDVRGGCDWNKNTGT